MEVVASCSWERRPPASAALGSLVGAPSVAISLMPGCASKEQEGDAPVLVEDVTDDDGDEDEDDDAHDALVAPTLGLACRRPAKAGGSQPPRGAPGAACRCQVASSGTASARETTLSPFAPSFHPGRGSEGRPKLRRWTKDFVDCSSDEDEGSVEASSPKKPTYLDVARRQPRPASPPPVRAQLRSIVVVDRTAIGIRGQGGGGKAAGHRRPRPRTILGRLPVHQRLGPQRGASVQCPRSHSPAVHVSRRGARVDADGFHIVDSHRRLRLRGRAGTTQQRPVPPELVGRCFNCLARGHVAAVCRFPTRCFHCWCTGHRARACVRGRPPPRRTSPLETGHDQAPPPSPPQCVRQSASSPTQKHNNITPAPIRRGRRHRRPRRRRQPKVSCDVNCFDPIASESLLVADLERGQQDWWVECVDIELAGPVRANSAQASVVSLATLPLSSPARPSSPGTQVVHGIDWWASLVASGLGSFPTATGNTSVDVDNSAVMAASPPASPAPTTPVEVPGHGSTTAGPLPVEDVASVDDIGTGSVLPIDTSPGATIASPPVASVDDFISSYLKPLPPPILVCTPPRRLTRREQAKERGEELTAFIPKRSARLAAKSNNRAKRPEDQARKVMLKKMGVHFDTEQPDAASFEEFHMALSNFEGDTDVAMQTLFAGRGPWVAAATHSGC